MANSPYITQKQDQYRGPTSTSLNQTIEEAVKDLVFLYNQWAVTKDDMEHGFLVFLKELVGLANVTVLIENRLAALEANANVISFTKSTQIDNDRFDNTPFKINPVDRCTYQSNYGVMTPPLVAASSMSKIKYSNTDGTYMIPASLEIVVKPVTPGVDGASAVVDTSQPYNAIVGAAGRVWERNVIVNAPDIVNGASMYIHISIPNDLSITPNTNCIALTTFPMRSVDVQAIEYSTDINVALDGSTTAWTPFNSGHIYYNAQGAVGHIIPGGWTGDTITNSPALIFYFEPKPITAIRIKLRQMNYFNESGKYIYSYGASKLDIRYDKFLDTGKTIIQFDAPGSDTISHIDGVTPQIWNVPEYYLNDVFSYRVIWETSYGSEIYTLTPVPFSQRVWVEVTLNKSSTDISPALSGLILSYS